MTTDKLKMEIIERLVYTQDPGKLRAVAEYLGLDNATPELIRVYKVKYAGFGAELTYPKWAKLAGLNRSTVFRNLRQGRTIEEIFARRGCTPPTAEQIKAMEKAR